MSFSVLLRLGLQVRGRLPSSVGSAGIRGNQFFGAAFSLQPLANQSGKPNFFLEAGGYQVVIYWSVSLCQ